MRHFAAFLWMVVSQAARNTPNTGVRILHSLKLYRRSLELANLQGCCNDCGIQLQDDEFYFCNPCGAAEIASAYDNPLPPRSLAPYCQQCGNYGPDVRDRLRDTGAIDGDVCDACEELHYS